jgi:hypothetical protein
MARKPPIGQDLISPARGISLAGLVLAALYLSILAGPIFPVQLLDQGWQLNVGSALINAAPFPLIGLAALHLARVLDPSDPLLKSRCRFASRLAVGVAFGFLLLIPLLSIASIGVKQQLATNQANLISRANQNLQALRDTVESAKNGKELRERLIALNGPVLDAQAPKRPLPELQAEVNSLIDQAEAQVARKQQELPLLNPGFLSALPGLLRNAFASLALAIGFAGLAQRKGSKLSLLAELIRWPFSGAAT